MVHPVESTFRAARSGLLLPLALVIAGCQGSREYVYTRSEPAMGRKAPTTFVVQYRVDPTKGTVIWVEDIHDRDGDIGRTMRIFKDCLILDDDDWECQPIIVGDEEVERLSMRRGKLTHRYWTENRVYEKRPWNAPAQPK